jgi:hypothetical protein
MSAKKKQKGELKKINYKVSGIDLAPEEMFVCSNS